MITPLWMDVAPWCVTQFKWYFSIVMNSNSGAMFKCRPPNQNSISNCFALLIWFYQIRQDDRDPIQIFARKGYFETKGIHKNGVKKMSKETKVYSCFPYKLGYKPPVNIGEYNYYLVRQSHCGYKKLLYS